MLNQIFQSPWDVSGIFAIAMYAFIVWYLRKKHADRSKTLGNPEFTYSDWSHSAGELATFLLTLKWLRIPDWKLWVMCVLWYVSLFGVLFALVLHVSGTE
jgi:hypothetical protein